MTRDEVEQLEHTLAKIVKQLRAEHAAELAPLRARLDAVERDLAVYEARAGGDDIKGSNVEWLKRGRR
jgi:uncharacterized protein involved in exopolysaccharide biosynthesis